MDGAILTVGASLVVVLIGGLLTLARQMTRLQVGKMDLSEHQKICDARNALLDKKFDNLIQLIKDNQELIEKKHDQNRTFQHDVRNEMHAISLKMERIMVTNALIRKPAILDDEK